MRDDLLALLLMMSGVGCIAAWAVCSVLAALRSNHIRRQADALKMHLVRGGNMPEGAPLSLARYYLHLRWLAVLGNVLLTAGIAVILLAHTVLF